MFGFTSKQYTFFNNFDCVNPENIITALKDAKEEMSYSNWHNDKFDRMIELVVFYCQENKIPMILDKEQK